MPPRHINFLTNAAASSSGIFIPLVAKSLSASPDQIGFLVAAFNAFGFTSSFLSGRAADVEGARKVLRAGLLLSAVAAVTQPLARDPLELAISRSVLGFAVGMYPAALLAYAKTADRLLGKFASYGSLGWGLGNLLAGGVASLYPGIFWPVFSISAVLWFVAFLAATAAPLSGTGGMKVPFFPVAILRRNLPIYLTMFIRHAGANMVWVVFPLYLSEVRAFSDWQIGVLYAFNPFVQFAVMQRIDRYRASLLIVTGLVGSSLTFLVFIVSADFVSMMAAQGLIGFSWATFYVGCLKFITEANPETGTAGGLFNGVMSISSIVGPVIGGFLALSSYEAPMYVAAALSTASLGFYAYEARLVRIRRGSHPAER